MTYYSEHKAERKAYGQKYYSDHKEEVNARNRVYAHAHPEINRNKRRKEKRGVGKEEFYFMLDAQDNKCAICGVPIADDQSTHTDHNHATGWPRGLLCAGCNLGIGFLRDDPKICRAAATYLEETP